MEIVAVEWRDADAKMILVIYLVAWRLQYAVFCNRNVGLPCRRQITAMFYAAMKSLIHVVA